MDMSDMSYYRLKYPRAEPSDNRSLIPEDYETLRKEYLAIVAERDGLLNKIKKMSNDTHKSDKGKKVKECNLDLRD
jgi:hypothetical protein